MRALITLLLSLWIAPAWAGGTMSLLGAGPGAPGASAVFAITYGSEVEDATSQTSYSLASVQVGSGAGSNGYPVIGVCLRSSNAISTPTVTINGGATAKVIESVNGAGPATYSGLFQSSTPVAPGSTFTVAISSFGSAAARAAVVGYMVATNTSALPSGAAISANSLSGSTMTGTITVPTSGASILTNCVTTVVSVSITAPATGVTQDYGAAIGASTTWINSGHDTTTRSGSTAYTSTYNVAPSSPAGVVAAWAP